MAKYIKCPRCELNYIDPRQDMCDVCKAELGEPLNTFIDEEDDLELCPICKRNFISFDEDMCQECRLAKEASSDPSEDDEGWREFIDEDQVAEDGDELPPEELDEDFSGEFEEDEEEEEIFSDGDEFEEVDSDYEFDDEDEEFDDDDDDMDF